MSSTRGPPNSFLQDFVQAKGPLQIVLVVVLLALGMFSTIGVVSCWPVDWQLCSLA
jgi:hypothetical protein